jgi:hypothetical protein
MTSSSDGWTLSALRLGRVCGEISGAFLSKYDSEVV